MSYFLAVVVQIKSNWRKRHGRLQGLHPRPNIRILLAARCRAGRKDGFLSRRFAEYSQEVCMSIFRDKYKMGDVDFFNIRNRNEGRVIRVLDGYIRAKNHRLVSDKDLQDIYSLAFNSLPPRYTQRGKIVLHDPVKKQEIYTAVDDAYDLIMAQPKP